MLMEPSDSPPRPPAWGPVIGPVEFADYMAAFNGGDVDGYAKYYADEAVFEGRGRHLQGRAAIVAFYATVGARMRQTITVRRAYFGETGMAAELETELVALADWPDFFSGPIRAGEVRRSLNFAFYAVKDGRFVHIRSAPFARLEGS
jgi:hypothetical protein